MAPKEKIWTTLLGKDTYPVWTAPFMPDPNGDNSGAGAVTDWKEGSDVKFLDGKGNGIGGIITKHILADTITMKYYGMIVNNQVITEGKEADEWKGAEETYKVVEGSGVSRLDISVDMADSFYDDMSAAWDKALKIVKEIAEKK